MLPDRDFNNPLDQEYDGDDDIILVSCPCDECDRSISCAVCMAEEWR